MRVVSDSLEGQVREGRHISTKEWYDRVKSSPSRCTVGEVVEQWPSSRCSLWIEWLLLFVYRFCLHRLAPIRDGIT